MKDYNLIWFTEKCLSNALRLETCVQDAEPEGDSELADFFHKAQAASRKMPGLVSRCCERGSARLATPVTSSMAKAHDKSAGNGPCAVGWQSR
jgi:hypothetical protein